MRVIELPQKRRGSPKKCTPIPPVRCQHNYPILLLATADDGRRGFCLGCESVGPARQGVQAAQVALISTCT
jgi:hypothetical protein